MNRALLTGVKGLVPAGVHHWDDSALDAVSPRVLLPVLQSPLIFHPLSWLQSAGIGAATVCANSSSRYVRRYFGDGRDLGFELDYFDDLTPRGPAGCLRDAGLDSDAQQFIVVDGTIVPRIDLIRMLQFHRAERADVTVAVEADIAVDGWRTDQLSPVGIYIFERSALEHVEPIGYQDIKEVLLPKLHRNKCLLLPYVVDEPCPRVAGVASYMSTTEWLLGELVEGRTELRGYRREGDSFIHSTAKIDDRARLMGPVVIGPHCEIGSQAVVVGPAVMGSECKLDRNATVSRSILWDRCAIGSDSLVDQCILADEAAVAPGESAHAAMLVTSERDSSAGGPDSSARSGAMQRPMPRTITGTHE